MSNKFIQIDEDGFFSTNGLRIDDEVVGREMLENLTTTERGGFNTTSQGQEAFVEAFDDPLVAIRVSFEKNWQIITPYSYTASFEIKSLTLDEWDRFHGVTDKGLPFVFSRAAQFQFFDLLDSFTDDTITFKGETFSPASHLRTEKDVNSSAFWDAIYEEEETPGWELHTHNPILKNTLRQLKLTRSQILVPGCGSGNDAAFFAEKGHLVTAMDFSQCSIDVMKKKYGSIKNLEMAKEDILSPSKKWEGEFDLIFEHTLFCAIHPEKRDQVIAQWKNLLKPKGHLLGIFFVRNYPHKGPPFTVTEWELKKRLEKDFDLLYWTRCKDSLEDRLGLEVVIYAQKKD